MTDDGEFAAVDGEIATKLVEVYEANVETISRFGRNLYDALLGSSEVSHLIHSSKMRLKDSTHLRGKILRKLGEARLRGDSYEVTSDNLLERVNDLVGIRLLHLYTRQVADINPLILRICDEETFSVIEGPRARTWDDESRRFFEGCGIETMESETMYTSIHYVVRSATRTPVTCEVQLRTLMEEVWGEVDHRLNYPVPTEILSSREQLKVLAKITAGASRLVDSIFLTHSEASGSDRTSADQ